MPCNMNSERKRRVNALLVERDGWTCHICGGRIDPDAPENDGAQASLDHIVPTSLSGTGEVDNLALAHRACNEERGDRPMEHPWVRAMHRDARAGAVA